MKIKAGYFKELVWQKCAGSVINQCIEIPLTSGKLLIYDLPANMVWCVLEQLQACDYYGGEKLNS